MTLTTFNPAPSGRIRHSQNGFMIIAMMAMLAIMLVYVAASTSSLRQLRQELKLVEQKQVLRLQSPPPAATATNGVVIAR